MLFAVDNYLHISIFIFQYAYSYPEYIVDFSAATFNLHSCQPPVTR